MKQLHNSVVEKYIQELTFKGYSENTINIYVHYVCLFLSNFNKNVYHISQTEAVTLLKSLMYSSRSKQNQCISSVKLLYKYVVGCELNKFNVERPRKEKKLPIVLSQKEIQRMFDVCDNLKHKTIISLLYACGLRVSELLNLKWVNIDRSSMILTIKDSKGNKDRQVDLPDNLIHLLELYYRQYKAKEYVLNGESKNTLKYSQTSVLNIIKNTAKKAGINKRVYTHLIRHCTFTHMAENKIDIGYIQNSAGHTKTDTTRLYIHLSHNVVKNAISPLNNIII